jgi:hypothetical protein
MDPRAREAAMLDRCVAIARSGEAIANAKDGREANVFRVAAMVIQSRFPVESKVLMQCADRYFLLHPHELGPVVDVVNSGDVISLPRLRDMLTMRFNFMGKSQS